jgi:hypothetical protein
VIIHSRTISVTRERPEAGSTRPTRLGTGHGRDSLAAQQLRADHCRGRRAKTRTLRRPCKPCGIDLNGHVAMRPRVIAGTNGDWRNAKFNESQSIWLSSICSQLFGPRLIRTEVWSRDGVLLQTASRHSHPVDKYGLCGTRLINNYFVETNISMVVRRRRTQTMSRHFFGRTSTDVLCA